MPALPMPTPVIATATVATAESYSHAHAPGLRQTSRHHPQAHPQHQLQFAARQQLFHRPQSLQSAEIHSSTTPYPHPSTHPRVASPLASPDHSGPLQASPAPTFAWSVDASPAFDDQPWLPATPTSLAAVSFNSDPLLYAPSPLLSLDSSPVSSTLTDLSSTAIPDLSQKLLLEQYLPFDPRPVPEVHSPDTQFSATPTTSATFLAAPALENPFVAAPTDSPFHTTSTSDIPTADFPDYTASDPALSTYSFLTDFQLNLSSPVTRSEDDFGAVSALPCHRGDPSSSLKVSWPPSKISYNPSTCSSRPPTRHYDPASNLHALYEQAMRETMAESQPQLPSRSSQRLLHRESSTAGDERRRYSGQGLGDVVGSPEELRMAMECGQIPKLDRTISDIYQDELYNPNLAANTYASQPVSTTRSNASVDAQPNANSQPATRGTDVFRQILQVANDDHLSARQNATRHRSPFQPGSRYAPDGFASSQDGVSRRPPPPQLQQVQQRNRAVTNGRQRDNTISIHDDAASDGPPSATVSPKEVELDFQDTDGSDTPLFSSTMSPRRPAPGKPISQLWTDASVPDRRRAVEPTQQTSAPSSQNTMLDFPSTLLSMESTKGSDTDHADGYGASPERRPVAFSLPQSSRESSTFDPDLDDAEDADEEGEGLDDLEEDEDSDYESKGRRRLTRPASTKADSGTYTCTYHGCTLRFETPAQLQRHKRDAHRPTSPQRHLAHPQSLNASTSASPRSPTSNAATLHHTTASGAAHASHAANQSAAGGIYGSQAGPHKCDRPNPSTGRPCNAVFSRPYDLTRHEDTIHNAKKPKVRCHLCTEEKTFSRTDALTRHMRVVHPEVDVAGKTRRRG